MKEITINVTQDDIRDGVPRNTKECPVARAVNRAFNTDTAEVDGYDIMVRIGVISAILDVPADVAVFIDTVDIGGMVEPMSFTIHVPGSLCQGLVVSND